jgi:hypothetical protein
MFSKKNFIKIFFIIIGSLIIFLLIGTRINRIPCVSEIPERKGEIPITARWIGDCDGGHWFNIIEMNTNKNTYHISIYHDYNGKLYVDDFFELDCKTKIYSSQELLDNIILYEGEISMKGSCKLIPITIKAKN